ncbi:MAG: hypothetical protein E6I91_16895 [Chloroflexi bacterium]|nr:MAG: hypothetical protein E6I91_16895 [Chloroflexota bacterium]
MDASTTLTITQAILDWALLGFLLAWMVTFAVLALRANPTHTMKSEELPTPARSFPAATAPASQHVIATHTTQPMPVQVGQVSHGTSGEMGTVPII